MKLQIVTPTHCTRYNVAWIEANGIDGSMVIQPGHVPTTMILSSKKDLNFQLTSGKEISIKVKNGILNVTRVSATLLISE